MARRSAVHDERDMSRVCFACFKSLRQMHPLRDLRAPRDAEFAEDAPRVGRDSVGRQLEPRCDRCIGGTKRHLLRDDVFAGQSPPISAPLAQDGFHSVFDPQTLAGISHEDGRAPEGWVADDNQLKHVGGDPLHASVANKT